MEIFTKGKGFLKLPNSTLLQKTFIKVFQFAEFFEARERIRTNGNFWEKLIVRVLNCQHSALWNIQVFLNAFMTLIQNKGQTCQKYGKFNSSFQIVFSYSPHDVSLYFLLTLFSIIWCKGVVEPTLFEVRQLLIVCFLHFIH